MDDVELECWKLLQSLNDPVKTASPRPPPVPALGGESLKGEEVGEDGDPLAEKIEAWSKRSATELASEETLPSSSTFVSEVTQATFETSNSYYDASRRAYSPSPPPLRHSRPHSPDRRRSHSLQADRPSRSRSPDVETRGPRHSGNHVDHRTLFLTGISKSTDWNDLEQIYAPFGRVVNTRVRSKKGSTTFGFVQFKHKSDAKRALEATHDTFIGPNLVRVRVTYAQKERSAPSSRTLLVSSIDSLCSELEVNAVFEAYGKVLSIRTPYSTGRRDVRIAFVTFEDVSDADRAREALDNSPLGSQRLTVSFAKEDTFDHDQKHGLPTSLIPKPVDDGYRHGYRDHRSRSPVASGSSSRLPPPREDEDSESCRTLICDNLPFHFRISELKNCLWGSAEAQYVKVVPVGCAR
ncbi:hypothetical protein BDY24DRAFT_63723 [Mrakia frigida]|uniref:RNA-binding protein n=1 Tax=Mrakia frigida TaxID=29902 RepID=UPI003FCBFFF9